ncbi:tudor domain-containing protein 3 [Coemansia sp. RSA 1200]|nr:tudor domain-containing protein 3 [Coemansia sp. RSA 1200]
MDVGISKHAMWEAVREKEDFEQRGIQPSYVPISEEDDQEQSGVFTSTNTQSRADHISSASGSADEMAGERVPKIPRSMLKLTLTDGRTRMSAVELHPIQQLDIGIPIGTKVFVRFGQILEQTGLLCLEQGSVQVLGGSPSQYQKHTLKARLEGRLDIRRSR